MPRKSINTSLPKDFEPRRKNPISLGKDSNIDNDSKSLKIGGEHTGIEFATDSVLFTKDVIIAGESTIKDVSITNLEVDGTITLDTSESLAVHINTGDSKIAKISSVANQGSLYLYSVLDSNDYSLLTTAADGATTFNSTNNSDSTLAHLTLQPGGDLKLDPVTQNIVISATDKLYFDGGTHTYIDEESDDRLRFTVGTDEMLILDEASDAITIAASNWIAGTVSGTTINEFSASNSAYAGMILGYTRLENDLTNNVQFEIQNSMTVEDSTHQITFKTPPSEIVEIEASFLINVVSTDTRISVGLSDSSTYNAVAAHLEYDGNSIYFSDDEANDSVLTVKWVLVAGQLAAIGSSNTFYIGFSTDGATKTAYLAYGLRAATGACEHPFVIKATALPTTIYDGL